MQPDIIELAMMQHFPENRESSSKIDFLIISWRTIGIKIISVQSVWCYKWEGSYCLGYHHCIRAGHWMAENLSISILIHTALHQSNDNELPLLTFDDLYRDRNPMRILLSFFSFCWQLYPSAPDNSSCVRINVQRILFTTLKLFFILFAAKSLL